MSFTRNYQIIKVALHFKLTKFLHCIFKFFTYPSQYNDATRTKRTGSTARSRRIGSRGRVLAGVAGGSAYARGGRGEPGQTRCHGPGGVAGGGRGTAGAPSGEAGAGAGAGAGVGWDHGRTRLRAAVRQRWRRSGSGAVEREREEERTEWRAHT